MTIQVGKSYKTRGGWKAKIVHVGTRLNATLVGRDACQSKAEICVLAIHYHPDLSQDRLTLDIYQLEELAYHDKGGRAIPSTAVGVFPPTFGREILHPADLIEEI